MCMIGCHLTTTTKSPYAGKLALLTMRLHTCAVPMQAMAQKPADLDYRELQRECKAAGVNAKGCVALACLPNIS